MSINEGTQRSVAYTNDQSGQVIYRQENPAGGGLGPRETFYRFAGKQMGYSGNNDSLNEDYATTIMFRQMSQGSGPFLNGGSTPMSEADFDQGVKLINSYTGGSSSGGYTVRGGETLSSIASNMWGDSSLWYKLAEANGLSGSSTLIEGQSLIIPPGVFRSTHNASTFTPYDPASTIGDTTPGPVQPKPKKQKCGMFGQILLLVIAVAMTAWLGPMWAPATNGFLQAAGWGAAGAVASAASQTAGLAAGIQSRFSWNQVATSAISSSISGGVASGLENAGIKLDWMARAGVSAATNIATQGATMAVGLQDKFSWASVAASAVGSLIPNLDGPLGLAVSISARAISSAGIRSLWDGTDFDLALRQALPDVIGSTIGAAMAEASLADMPAAARSFASRLVANSESNAARTSCAIFIGRATPA